MASCAAMGESHSSSRTPPMPPSYTEDGGRYHTGGISWGPRASLSSGPGWLDPMHLHVDDTLRDVSYALRTFRRAPLVAFTVVSTVALGLGLVTVVFTMLSAFLFRVDAVPEVHEMFAVGRAPTKDAERRPFTRAQFDALRRETSVFSDAYAVVSDVDSLLDGRRMSGTFVTGNFFQVLRVSAAIGRALTPADDAPSAGPVMVLSHRGWDRLFARDPAILGRRLLVNGLMFEIVGVMPEGFRGLTLAPDDYW